MLNSTSYFDNHRLAMVQNRNLKEKKSWSLAVCYISISSKRRSKAHPFPIHTLQSDKQSLQLFDCNTVTGQDSKKLHQFVLKQEK